MAPFDHSGYNVSIYDHVTLASFLVEEFTIDSEARTALFGNAQNVTALVSNITDSMTNMIMKRGSGMTALGVAWHEEPVFHIQRAWLALPLALVLSSAILLVSIITTSRHLHAPEGKSSPLPYLYHGIQKWDDKEENDLIEGRLEKMHVMKDRARSKRVQIFTTLEGGRWLV